MDNFSHEELIFVRESADKGIRLDTRNLRQRRYQEIVENEIPQTEKSMKIVRGVSEIEINIGFRLIGQSSLYNKNYKDFPNMDNYIDNLDILNLIFKNVPLNHQKSLSFLLSKLEEISKPLKDFLKIYNLAIIIEITAIKNDGGIVEMVLNGLSLIFQNIKMLKISNILNEVWANLEIPRLETYVFFGKTWLLDPTYIEESSCDSLIHLIWTSDNKRPSIMSEKSYDAAIVENLLREKIL